MLAAVLSLLLLWNFIWYLWRFCIFCIVTRCALKSFSSLNPLFSFLICQFLYGRKEGHPLLVVFFKCRSTCLRDTQMISMGSRGTSQQLRDGCIVRKSSYRMIPPRKGIVSTGSPDTSLRVGQRRLCAVVRELKNQSQQSVWVGGSTEATLPFSTTIISAIHLLRPKSIFHTTASVFKNVNLNINSSCLNISSVTSTYSWNRPRNLKQSRTL